MIKKVYLIVGADQKVRVVVSAPRLSVDEVAIAINLRFPNTWGRVTQTIDLDIPDFAPVAEVKAA